MLSRIFLSAGAAVVFGLLITFLWHLRIRTKNLPRRKQDYVWAFIEGGILYVMGALLIAHNFFGEHYNQILSDGFGEPQVNVAFWGTLFEAVGALWDLWIGNGMTPGPEI